LKGVAIIPARGGSKGIPMKNIKLLAGKPLIAYTIDEAVKCQCFDRIIVSTDDPKIAKISQENGADILMRPKELAEDGTPTVDVIVHAIKTLEKEEAYVPDYIVVLQPTSPLRSSSDILTAINLFLNKSDNESLVSVFESEHPLSWAMNLENGHLIPLFDEKSLKKQRQAQLTTYFPNGAIYVISRESLYKNQNLYSEKTLAYIMPVERSIDIDTEYDFMIAEFLIKKECNTDE
jgi:CMP-N-acetylneuraminic acid synthetase